MMVNLLDDSNFHRQTAVMTRLVEMIIQNPVFGIFCIISMLAHPTSQCLTSFTTRDAVNVSPMKTKYIYKKHLILIRLTSNKLFGIPFCGLETEKTKRCLLGLLFTTIRVPVDNKQTLLQ